MPTCVLGMKPANDRGYLEAMAKIIFSIGLNRSVVESKWGGILDVFAGFDPEKVAQFTGKDIDRITKDQRVIRNHLKVVAIVRNAQRILLVRKEFGSFHQYLQSVSRAGEMSLREAVKKQFFLLGERTVVFFLRSVGERLPETMRQWDSYPQRSL